MMKKEDKEDEKKVEEAKKEKGTAFKKPIDVLIKSYKVTGDVGELFPLLRKVDEEIKKREQEGY